MSRENQKPYKFFLLNWKIVYKLLNLLKVYFFNYIHKFRNESICDPLIQVFKLRADPKGHNTGILN
jgi:hypothetical protein